MNNELHNLPPFIDFCVKFLGYEPSAYDDYEKCFTYLECLVYTYTYLKEQVVPLVNDMKDYIDHYFDNLDVQEEINNKLDQMAIDGTLGEIIETYTDLPQVKAEVREIDGRVSGLEADIPIITSDISTLNTTVNEQGTAISSLSSTDDNLQEQITTNANRISEFTNLSEGSTTGDAELIDGRIGFNASTYANIGDAIRGQTKNNYDELNLFISQYATDIAINTLNWEIGSIQNNTGAKVVTSGAIRFTDFIKVNKGSIVKLNNYTGYSFKVFVYSTQEHSQTNVIEQTTEWQTTPYVITKDGYLKCVIKGNGTISDASTVSIYFDAHLFTISPFASTSDLTIAENNITGIQKELEGTAKQISNIYDLSTESWESGVIYTNGMKGTNAKCIRTIQFMPCKKNSVIYLSDYSHATFRVLVYPEASFTTPTEATAWQSAPYTIQNDGYLMLVVYDVSATSIADQIATYSALVKGVVFTSLDESEIYKLPTSWTQNLSTLKKLQGTDIAIGIQTDTHYSILNNDSANIGNDLKELTNYLGLDYIANLGDIIQGYEINTLADMKTSFTEIMHRYIDNCRCQFFYTVGNHDDCSLIPQEGGAHDLDGYILGDEIYANTIPFVNNTGKIVNNQKLYYYKDFANYRVIVLNTRDIPFETFSVDDINVNHHEISDAQVTWFTNTALDTDLPVIVMCHVPLIASLLPDVNGVENADDIVTALEAFQTNGGTVIAVLSGHSHQQNQDKVNGINYITFKNGGQFAELLFINLTDSTITSKIIGTAPSGIVDRSFTF